MAFLVPTGNSIFLTVICLVGTTPRTAEVSTAHQHDLYLRLDLRSSLCITETDTCFCRVLWRHWKQCTVWYSRGKFWRSGSCCVRHTSWCYPWKTTLSRGRSLVSSGGHMSLSQNIQGILWRFATGHRGPRRAQLGKQGHIYQKLKKKITEGMWEVWRRSNRLGRKNLVGNIGPSQMTK